MTKDPNRPDNADNCGGPSFHPDIDIGNGDKKKAPADTGANSKDSDNGAILDKDQVPPL